MKSFNWDFPVECNIALSSWRRVWKLVNVNDVMLHRDFQIVRFVPVRMWTEIFLQSAREFDKSRPAPHLSFTLTEAFALSLSHSDLAVAGKCSWRLPF